MTRHQRRALLAICTTSTLVLSTFVGWTLFGAPPASAADTPPNPISKPGYFLTANDEFNVAGATLTPKLWNTHYLQHWTTVDSSARYNITGGNLDLRIDPDTSPWDPIRDGDTRVSGVQTAERNWLHNWAGYTAVANPQPTTAQHVQKYGYFELRAKAQRGGGIHSAWWMLGAQQDVVNGSGSQQTAEVDLFEIVGRDQDRTTPRVNLLHWSDPNTATDTGVYDLGFDPADGYHVYEFEWTPSEMKFYADGKLIKTFNQSVNYPMLTLLGIYEKRVNGWTGPFDPSIPYPKVFSIDYFRAYQKIPTLPYTFQADDAALLGNARSVSATQASGGRVAGYIGQGSGNRAVYDQLYAPSAGNRQMAIRYASAEARNLTYQVNGGAPVTVTMPSTGGWTTFGTYTITANLNAGKNQIQFYNATGWAPDLDTVTVQSTGTGTITGIGGKCVDVYQKSSDNGTPVQLWTCNGGSNQQWTLPGDGTVRSLGKCLSIPDGQTGNGTQVELWDCNGGATQQWTAGSGLLMNSLSGRCLHAPGDSTRLQIWDCNGGSNQIWTLPSA